MSGEDWRTEVDAVDYFGHQKKRVSLEQRRPVIKKAGDLVGPGIDAAAVRITNWNDILATFDGYYSSLPGAFSAPDATDSFVGVAVSDSELGGTQTITGINSKITYTRVFVRNPANPETLGFSDWTPAHGSANIVRLGDLPLVALAAQWTALALINPEVRGSRILYESPGVIRVTLDGWYETGVQTVVDTAMDAVRLLVVAGDSPEDDNIIMREGGGPTNRPALGGTSVDYLEAGTRIQAFVFATALTGLYNNYLYCREA